MFRATFSTPIISAADRESTSRRPMRSMSGRPLQGVYVNPATSLAAASDGSILAVTPVVIDGDDVPADPCILPQLVFTRSACVVECNGEARNPASGVTMPFASGQFPDVGQVLTDAAATIADGSISVDIDVDLLHRLAKAISDDQKSLRVTLSIPCLATPTSSQQVCGSAIGVVGSHGVGLLMPRSSENVEVATNKLREAVAVYRRA